MQLLERFKSRKKKVSNVWRQAPTGAVSKIFKYGIPVLTAVLVVSVVAVYLLRPNTADSKEFAKVQDDQIVMPKALAEIPEQPIELPQIKRDLPGLEIHGSDNDDADTKSTTTTAQVIESTTVSTTPLQVVAVVEEPKSTEQEAETEDTQASSEQVTTTTTEEVTVKPTHRFEHTEYEDSWKERYITFPLHLREVDNFDAKVLETIPKGTKVMEYRTNGLWSYILHDNFEGYVYSEYLSDEYVEPDHYEAPVSSFEERSGTLYIAAGAARLRAEATTGSDEVHMVSYGQAVTILAYGTNDIGEGWYKVQISTGDIGYIRSDLLRDTPVPEDELNSEAPVDQPGYQEPSNNEPVNEEPTDTPAETPQDTVVEEQPTPQTAINNEPEVPGGNEEPAPPPATGGGPGAEVSNLAQSFLGYPYVWAAHNPSVGFDCSGLTYYCYMQFGVTLPRTAAGQLGVGTAVPYGVGDYSQLRPGDLCLFTAYGGNGGGITHVGMYIGNNLMVHASTPSTGVIVSDLNSEWYRFRLAGVRRIFN